MPYPASPLRRAKMVTLPTRALYAWGRMERVREAIKVLDPQEAYLVSDRAVEVLLRDSRLIRITAKESLRGGGFTADHEIAVVAGESGRNVTLWGTVDLPWATGDTAEDCLAQAILLMHS
jgi:hypothetical protein